MRRPDFVFLLILLIAMCVVLAMFFYINRQRAVGEDVTLSRLSSEAHLRAPPSSSFSNFNLPPSSSSSSSTTSTRTSHVNLPPSLSSSSTRTSHCRPLDAGKRFDLVIAAVDNKDTPKIRQWLDKLANLTLNVVVYRRVQTSLGLEQLSADNKCGTSIRELELLPNRGYEAAPYLDHIVRNYNDLGDVTAFVHAGGAIQWHTDAGEFYRKLFAVYDGLHSSSSPARKKASTLMFDLNACPCVSTKSKLSGLNFNWISWSVERKCVAFPGAMSCAMCETRGENECGSGGKHRMLIEDPSLDKQLYPFKSAYWPDPRGGAYAKYAKVFSQIWKEENITKDNYAVKSFDPCCAQFTIARKIIQIHQKRAYERLLNLALDKKNEMPDDHALSRLFEWSWRRLFNASVMEYEEALVYSSV